MRELKHLRDFLTEEELKFLPGRLLAGNFMLLQQHRSEMKDGVRQNFRQTVQVFTADGTWIGCIEHPDYLPRRDYLN